MIGDDESTDYFFYDTSKMQYWRSMLSIIFDKNCRVKINLGYSYALTGYSYTFSGPGFPTFKQLNKIENGLGSGIILWLELGSLGDLSNRKK